MLSHAELDLIRRDPELPGLAKLLDAETFQDALRSAAPEVNIGSARLRYLRYKPGQNCLAAYTLDIAGEAVECHAKAYRLDDAAKLEKAEVRQNITGLIGVGRFVWPHLGIEVCIFPNDNKLAALALLADPVRRLDLFKRHLPDQPALWPSSVLTLAYKPERRWVGALQVDGEPRAVCKLYTEAAFEEARVKAKHFRQGEVLKLAPVIGRSKGRQMLCFGWQKGDLLSQTMRTASFDPGVLTHVGRALGELQQQDIPALPLRSNAGLAGAVLELSTFVSFLLPRLAGRVHAVANRLAAALNALPPGNTTIHGDFYAKQILLEGQHVTVLDLDEAARGDGLTDVGSFLAHLEREVVAGRIKVERLATMRERLIAGYRHSGGLVIDKRLELHTAERLFARLADFFRTHDSDWPQRTEELLARIEALVASLRHSADSIEIIDPKLPLLERAMSPLVIEPQLTKLLSQRDQRITAVTLDRVKLRRHKPGRRALVEYGLEVQRLDGVEFLTLLGKLRRRGVDAENLSLLRELSAGSFAANSADDMAIPEVFGAMADFGITLQRRVEGQPLAELLSTTGGARAAQRAAEAISKLHHSELLPSKTHTIADELEILAARLATLAETKPEWAVRLGALMHACHELARQLPIVSPRPIHRDFYHDQLLLDGDRVWLLDLDLLCAGDPALDAGNFVGHLLEWAERSPQEGVALRHAAAAFMDRFLELNGNCAAETVEAYATLTLARHVSISTQFVERVPFTEHILEMCEERCSLAAESNRGGLAAASTL